MVPGMNHCGGGSRAYAIDYLHYLERWVEQGEAPAGMTGAPVNEVYLAAQPIRVDIPDMTAQFRLFIAALGLEMPLHSNIPVDFTRPVYPYPLYARYSGKGNSRDAGSFRAVAPPAR
jgi:hypothetical protein